VTSLFSFSLLLIVFGYHTKRCHLLSLSPGQRGSPAASNSLIPAVFDTRPGLPTGPDDDPQHLGDLCTLLQNVTDGSHGNIDLLPALVVASLSPLCSRKEAKRKASLCPVYERKTTRLLHWLCVACILADGYPDCCITLLISVNACPLSRIMPTCRIRARKHYTERSLS
jgi:hypothetical protein